MLEEGGGGCRRLMRVQSEGSSPEGVKKIETNPKTTRHWYFWLDESFHIDFFIQFSHQQERGEHQHDGEYRRIGLHAFDP